MAGIAPKSACTRRMLINFPSATLQTWESAYDLACQAASSHACAAPLHTSWTCLSHIASLLQPYSMNQVTLCHYIQARRDEATQAQLSRKTANKMARADLIEAQRQALLQEMQHIRKDILQQESWLRVCYCP